MSSTQAMLISCVNQSNYELKNHMNQWLNPLNYSNSVDYNFVLGAPTLIFQARYEKRG